MGAPAAARAPAVRRDPGAGAGPVRTSLPRSTELRLTDAPGDRRVPAHAVRWTDPASWHLTLTFLGAVPEAREAELAVRLAKAAGQRVAMRLSVVGGGRFGHRVLWVGIDGERQRARWMLAGATANAARRERHRGGGPPVPAAPHARARPPGSRPGDGRAALADYAGPEWIADQLLLVHSVLGAGAGGTAEHVMVERWQLG